MSGERECSPSREHARPRGALSTLVKNGRVGASGSSDTVSETDRFSETGGGGSIVVDLAAIDHNVRVLREHAGDAATMAVVKADGYNHGAVHVAHAALAAGALELGVTTVAEALALRDAGITAPILCWLHRTDTDFAPAIASGVAGRPNPKVSGSGPELARCCPAAAERRPPATDSPSTAMAMVAAVTARPLTPAPVPITTAPSRRRTARGRRRPRSMT